MSFIKLKDGRSINSAHVVSYTYGGEDYALFDLTDGRQVSGEVNEDFEEAFFPTIPAAPGFYEIFADVREDLTRHCYKRAIIGWRICACGNYPVLEGVHDAGKNPVGQMYPNGECTDVDGNSYPGLAQLQAAIAAEDIDFLAKAYPAEKAVSTAFKITNVHIIDPDGEKILMVAAHSLEGGCSLPFGIVIESHNQAQQDLGQVELSALVEAVGITDFADEKQLIGKYAVIHLEKTGRDRFTALPATVPAA